MKNPSILRAEDQHGVETESSSNRVFEMLTALKSALAGVFTSSAKPRRRTQARLGIEGLEPRLLMTAADVWTPVDNTPVFDLDTPQDVTYKTPHFATDQLEVSAENPITIRSTFTFENSFSYPNIIIANSDSRDSRTQTLHDAIYVQIGRVGGGTAMQMLGGDDSDQQHLSYQDFAIGDTVDAEVTYDGTTVQISAWHEGTQCIDETYTPPNAYTNPQIGWSGTKWDSGVVTSTLEEYIVYHGSLVPEGSSPTVEEEQPQQDEQVDTPASSLDTLYESTDAVGLSRKTPHFVTDYVDVSEGDPVTVNAQFTFDDAFSIPSVLIAQSGRMDHRNGLREAIYVEIGRDGNGYICQFLGSDDCEYINFQYEELPEGGTIDMEVTYNGSEVTLKALLEGIVITEQTMTPPIRYESAQFGYSNMRWDSDTVSATLQDIRITRGFEAIESEEEQPQQDEQVDTPASSLDTLYQSTEPLPLSQKTPHFVTDYVAATPEDPVTINAQFTYEDSFSYPSVLIAQSGRTDSRNGLRNAIYVQLGRDGNGAIYQFLGSDDNESTQFQYGALPVGATIDVEVTYDGTDVSVSATHDGIVFVETTFTPPIAYDSAQFGVSNMRWDSDTVSATAETLTVIQGIEAEEEFVGPLQQNVVAEQEPDILGDLLDGMPEVSRSDSPEDRLLALQAKQEFLQGKINDVSLQMADIETQIERETVDALIASLTIQRDEMQEQINALERMKIPYSSMNVAPTSENPDDDHVFGVEFLSNREVTYFEVFLDGEPGTIDTRLIEHTSGMADGYTEFDIRAHHGGNGNGTVTIRMYGDAEGTELLDEFHGSYNRSTTHVSGETVGSFEDLETGRIVDTPFSPTLSIVDISGPNILVAAQSPYDNITLSIDGGGLFTFAQMSQEGGAELQSHIFTFNTDMPAGRYAVWMREGRNNRVIARRDFLWDPVTGEVSLVGQNPTLRVSQGNPASDVMQSQLAKMDTMERVTTNEITVGAVRNVLQEHLYTRSSFYVDADNAIDYINGSSWEGHPDANVIFHRGLEGWEAAIRETLQAAAFIAQAAWSGESQEAAIAEFHVVLQRVLTYDYLRRYWLSDTSGFAQEFPSADELIAEGVRLAEETPMEFVEAWDEQVEEWAYATYIASHKELQGGGDVELVKSVDLTLVASETSSYGEGFELVDTNGQELTFGGRIEASLSNIDASIFTFHKRNTQEVLPGSENTLVLLIHGAGDVPKEGEEQGMDKLANSLGNAAHLISVRSGNRLGSNPDEFNAETAISEVKLLIFEYIKQHPEIDSIVIAGYSWGGGTTYKLADWITNDEEAPDISIKATAYIDAIEHNDFNTLSLLPPGTLAHGNWYQSGNFALHGSPTYGINALRTKIQKQIVFAEEGKIADHYNIDEQVYPEVAEFITSIFADEKL